MSNKLDTNLNVSPYFDDYDDTKNFHRILFKPTVAVQARELTQVQSILQDQISRHGSYTFKDGAIVDGCAITYISQMPVAYLKNRFDVDDTLSPLDIDDSFMLYANSGVRAAVLHSKVGFELTYPETNRFYLAYLSSGKDVSNNDIYEFQSGEKLYVYNGNQSKFATLDSNNLIDSISIITSNATANAIGTAYGVTTSEGMIYQKGFFINVGKHTIPVRDHDRQVNGYVIGFSTQEIIINSDQDSSLKSLAAGFENYNAPGADRLKLTPTLISKARSDTNTTNFFAVAEFDGDYPTETNFAEKNLNQLLDVIAERTYSESGNYSVSPFIVTPVENTVNTANFGYQISKGVAYINGYRVQTEGQTISIDKANTTRAAEAQIVTANFGNYVIVDEVAGVFDFDKVTELSIYDVAQNTISEYEAVYTAPVGNLVGKANVLGFQYLQGAKGSSGARYKLFLTNIRMNSGKSFATDGKSFYMQGTYGYAKADAVLESNQTILKDADIGTLIFPFGVQAIKRLRDELGGNDTNFVFRDITSATMASNGTVTFTINSPANGGTEKLNSSPGILSTTNALNYNIKLANNAYSANLAGSVSVNTTSTSVIGSGTQFSTWFNPGDSIRINVGGTFYLRNIASIASNTAMVLDTALGGANTAAKIQKYYTAGHVVNLMDFGGSITVLSNTQFVVDSNLDMGTNLLDSGTVTAYAEYPVLRSDAVEAKKIINKKRYIKIDCATNAGGITGPWDLGFVDVSKVRNVYVNGTYIEDNDRIEWFVMNNGQKDGFYDHATLSVKPDYKSQITSSTKLSVVLDYFSANTSTGVGFFSVDSYPIDDANTANTLAIQTAEIPLFYSSKYGQTIDLRNSIDFRPRKFNTANGAANTLASATINPAVANASFDVPGSGQYIIDPDTNFQADLEYYLPRVDLVVVNRFGDFSIRKGQPSEKPIIPMNEDDSVVIATANVTPFPSLSTQQGTDFDRDDLAVVTNIETVLRYTMEDIKIIDERIARLEYYTTLNLLESRAKDLTILDENGVDRFKNGIFADSFITHELGKTSDIEYSIAIDEDEGWARPNFEEFPVDLKYVGGASDGVTKTGSYLTRPYTSETFINQRFATDTRNCTADMWNWSGNMKLYPAYDHYKEIKETKPTKVIQDLTDATKVKTGKKFGQWRTAKKKNGKKDTETNTSTSGSTTTTVTKTKLERIVKDITAKTKIDKLDLGKYVTNVDENPYMRSRIVAFICSGMKPNTDMHVFFNGVNVDLNSAPADLSGVTEVEAGKENEILKKNAAWGSPIRSNAAGDVLGVFKIPADTFRCGDLILQVTNVPSLTVNESSILTNASREYVASSTTITTSSTVLVTKTQVPVIKKSIDTKIDRDTNSVTAPTFADHGRGGDPIAQTFDWVVPEAISGAFLTQIGVFFFTKDRSLGCSVIIMETQLGFPVTENSLGRGYLKSSEISTSTDGTVETIFVMDNPIYLESDKQYAFMVLPDGNSPEYNVWTAKTGFYDVKTNEQVFQNPYSGILFSSSSADNWTPLQTEDMKFNVYRANFTLGTGTAVFRNDDDDYLTIRGMTKANTALRVEIGDAIVKVVANTKVTNTANVGYAKGFVQFFDEANDLIYLDSSNGKLFANDVIEFHRAPDNSNSASFNANTLIANATIASVDNIEYHAIVPRFSTIFPTRTSIEYAFTGTDLSYVQDSNFTTVQPETENEFINVAKSWNSKSNEVTFDAAQKSAAYSISLSTQNRFVSPVIDLSRKSSILVQNIINNDNTNEHTRHGNAVTKYISQNVVLDDNLGNAEDLNVWVGAYRPAGTEVEVYVKLQGSDDGEVFDDKLWSKMIMTTKSSKVYSSPINRDDFREFEYHISNTVQRSIGSSTDAYLNNGIVQYARADGSLIVGFKTFSLKIVLLAENKAKIPIAADIRAIALQK